MEWFIGIWKRVALRKEFNLTCHSVEYSDKINLRWIFVVEAFWHSTFKIEALWIFEVRSFDIPAFRSQSTCTSSSKLSRYRIIRGGSFSALSCPTERALAAQLSWPLKGSKISGRKVHGKENIQLESWAPMRRPTLESFVGSVWKFSDPWEYTVSEQETCELGKKKERKRTNKKERGEREREENFSR